ncbi:hypothetical protein K2173_006392 [Erythroxylum novogranatense]|uniref:RING-type E3 ubiquitin transferase n=1 Tax=Erythroxylum novogranatense TaxID=1862640 RepID=A0AAV8U384_9ROSI|nr:hypothetical protein K2173_006392 [Erythroxylum novogranatense]
MASETDQAPEFAELSSFFERLVRHRDLSLFLPFILGFTAAPATSSPDTATFAEGENPSPNPEDPVQVTQQRTTPNERIILINPFTQGMVVFEGAESLNSLLRDLGTKNGRPPASKASIEAIPSVEIGESEAKDGECVICLEEWELGGVAKEMPCKHRFHANCIEKWLGIHGSCPVCRYEMPVDEEEGKKRDEAERRRLGREIWVSFSLNGNSRRNDDSNQATSNDSSNNVSSSTPIADHETEG